MSNIVKETAKELGMTYAELAEGIGLSWGSQSDRINKDKRFDIKTVDFTGKDNKPRNKSLRIFQYLQRHTSLFALRVMCVKCTESISFEEK